MKQNQMRTISWRLIGLIVALAILTGLIGCSSAKALDGSDKDAVLVYSEPIADNLLAGMNAADYAAFSRDFNDKMKTAIPEQTMTDNLLPKVTGKVGKYVSRTVDSVNQIGSDVLVVYTAKFEQADDVTIRLTLEQADPHRVAGLYFNSPKLQGN